MPPALIQFLAPLALRSANSQYLSDAAAESGESSVLASTSVTTALKQRVALLQAENDELGELLSSRTIGKLYEENRLMKRNVARLEDALRGMSILSQFYTVIMHPDTLGCNRITYYHLFPIVSFGHPLF